MVETWVEKLRELSLAFPREECAWESRPHFDPPPTPEAVAAFERAAGFTLPADVHAFFALTGAVVGMSVHNGYWLGGIDRLSCDDFPRAVAGDLAAPIATDGGGNAFLICIQGRVWQWDHEKGSVSRVADSCVGFLERVAADWAAYVENTPGWRFMV